MGTVQTQDGPDSKSSETLAELHVFLDNRELVITKKNFTWLTLFATVGGIQKTIKMIFFFLSAIISRRMFMASVLSNLYFIEKKKLGPDDDVSDLADIQSKEKLDLDNAGNAFLGKDN